MDAYLFDTNHLSPLVTLSHPLRVEVLRRQNAGDVFGVPTPALAEMLYGIQVIPRASQNVKEWDRLKWGFIYYDVTQVDARRAADLKVMLRHRGWQLGMVDALIAAIALRHDLTLLTTDKDFSAILTLKQENWLP